MSKNLSLASVRKRNTLVIFIIAVVALLVFGIFTLFNSTTRTEAAPSWTFTQNYAGLSGNTDVGSNLRILINPATSEMVLLGENGNNDVGSTPAQTIPNPKGGLFLRYGANFSTVLKISELDGEGERAFAAVFDKTGDLHVVLSAYQFKYFRLRKAANTYTKIESAVIMDGDCVRQRMNCEYPALAYNATNDALYLIYNEHENRDYSNWLNWHTLVTGTAGTSGTPFPTAPGATGTQVSGASLARKRLPVLKATSDGNLYLGIRNADSDPNPNFLYLKSNGSGGWTVGNTDNKTTSHIRIAIDSDGVGHFFYAESCTDNQNSFGTVIFNKDTSKSSAACVNGNLGPGDRVYSLGATDTSRASLWVAGITNDGIRYMYSENKGVSWQPGPIKSGPDLLTNLETTGINMDYANGLLVISGKKDGAGGGDVWYATTPIVVIPPTPSNFGVSAIGHNTVVLGWSDTANETSYTLQRATDAGFTANVQPFNIPQNQTSYTDTTVTEGTQYYYRLKASNAQGESAYTAGQPAVTKPNPPTNLAVQSVSGGTIILQFTDNSSVEENFEVERLDLTVPGSNYTVVGSPGAQAGTGNITFTDDKKSTPPPALDKSYQYRVRAKTVLGGNQYSTYSNVLFAESAPNDFNIVVGTPQNQGSTATLIAWVNTDSSYEDGYRVVYGPSGFTPVTITVGAGNNSYLMTGLTPETLYSVKVEAFSASGGTASQSTTFTTAPAAPTGLTILPGFNLDQIQFSFTDNSTAETGFVVERKDGIAGTWTVLTGYSPFPLGAHSSTVTVTVTDNNNGTAFAAGRIYFYAVRATHTTNGNSDFSNIATTVDNTTGWVVTKSTDTGDINDTNSLSWAINQANNSSDPNEKYIVFALGITEIQVQDGTRGAIFTSGSLTSAFPVVNANVAISGRCGSAGPQITIKPSASLPANSFVGLILKGGDALYGLHVRGFSAQQIKYDGSLATPTANFGYCVKASKAANDP